MQILNTLVAAGLLVLPTQIADAAEGAGSARAAQQQSGPLKPGRSAGVRAAQLPRTGLALVGAGAIVAVVAVVAGSGGGGNSIGAQSNIQSVPTTTP